MLRYVERNAVRANLVARAELWRWSSAPCWQAGALRPSFLADSPVGRGRNWLERVNQPLTEAELAAVRRSVSRGSPYGKVIWVETTAERLGLESSLRARGRPRKGEAGAKH